MDPLWVFFLLVLHVSVCGADGTSSPPTIPSRGLFSGFSPAQPFYVGSGTIGTSYPDVGVILMSWTYARDVMVHNKPVYALATQLALKHVHESGILGTRMIRMDLLDDGASSQQAQRNLLTGLISDQNTTRLPMLGVLGSQLDVSALGLLEIASTLDLVGMSAAPSFDWMNKYLYQTIAVTNVQIPRLLDATFALAASQGWRRVAILAPQDGIFNAMLGYITTRYANIQQYYGVIAATFIGKASSHPDGYMSLLPLFITNLQTLLKNQVTVFVLPTFDARFEIVIHKALAQLGLLDNPNYMILCTGAWCISDSALPAGTVGMNVLNIRALPADAVRYDNMVNDILRRTALLKYNSTEQEQVKQLLTDPSMISVIPHYYDMGYILTSAIATLYQSGVPFTSQNVYQIICNSTWNSSVSGVLRFDNRGILAAPIAIYQRDINQNRPAAAAPASSLWNVMGVYNALNAINITTTTNNSEAIQQFEWSRDIIYYTPNHLPILDQIVPAVPSLWHTSNSLNDGIFWWAGIVTGLILLLAMFLLWYRDMLLVHCAQLGWSLLLLLSLVGLSVSTVLYVLSPAKYSWICHVRPWFTSTSLVCVLVTLLTKVNRIRCIYNNPHIHSARQQHSKTDTWIFSTLLLPQFILLVAFSAANLSQPTTFTSSSIGDNTFAILCTDLENRGWLVWFIFELVYVFCLLLLLLYMAFSIRHTPSAFNESIHLLACVFALCVMLTILVPLQFIVNTQPSAVLLVRGIGQPLTAFIITVILFAPKIRYIYLGRGNDSSLAEKHIFIKGGIDVDNDISELHSIVADTTNIGQSNHNTTIRCAQLETQMMRIRALLLKYASNDDMNDEGLNLMFSISQLAGGAEITSSMNNLSSFPAGDNASPYPTVLPPHHQCTLNHTHHASSIDDVCPDIASKTKSIISMDGHTSTHRTSSTHHISSLSVTPITEHRLRLVRKTSPRTADAHSELELASTTSHTGFRHAESQAGPASLHGHSNAHITMPAAAQFAHAPTVERDQQASHSSANGPIASIPYLRSQSPSFSQSEMPVTFWGVHLDDEQISM